MIKIFNYDINPKKKILYSLCKIFGINKTSSLSICYTAQVNPILTWNDIEESKYQFIINALEKDMKKYKDFEKSKKNNILRFIKNGSVKGFRHKNNLPVRGQRTHSNAKTARNLKKKKK